MSCFYTENTDFLKTGFYKLVERFGETRVAQRVLQKMCFVLKGSQLVCKRSHTGFGRKEFGECGTPSRWFQLSQNTAKMCKTDEADKYMYNEFILTVVLKTVLSF